MCCHQYSRKNGQSTNSRVQGERQSHTSYTLSGWTISAAQQRLPKLVQCLPTWLGPGSVQVAGSEVMSARWGAIVQIRPLRLYLSSRPEAVMSFLSR